VRNQHEQVAEDGGKMFLQNVGPYKIHMVPHPRRRHSSSFYFHYHVQRVGEIFRISFVSLSELNMFNINLLSERKRKFGPLQDCHICLRHAVTSTIHTAQQPIFSVQFYAI
jgi:hypothetical protein